jgi:catechol 2,3-dioxygenase-like lactoylglutathione lyase family enzyme
VSTQSAGITTGITHLDVVSVPVSDQDRAKSFYVDVLGFAVIADSAFDNQRWVQLAPSGSNTSITLVTWFESMPAGSLKGLVLATEDIHASYDALAARGLQWNGPIEDAFWGIFAMFDDPDGNSWVVSESRAG